jgi:hypothetical protein
VPEVFTHPVAHYATAAKAFLDRLAAARHGCEPGPDRPAAAEALAAHRLVDAAYRSASVGGAPVAIDAR